VEAHAGLGWLIGAGAPGSERGLRAWCVAAAVLPDVDAIAYLFGPVAYGRYHHTFGHNVFLGLAVVAAASLSGPALQARQQIVRGLLVALAFGAHLVADMKLSAYAVYLFWPLSHRGFEFTPNLGLASPVNTWLVAASAVVTLLIAFWKGVTPLELLSPHLDARVRRALSPRQLRCATCGAACSDRCDGCGTAVCSREGVIDRRFRLACPACAAAAATAVP
jgi:hypothetical protein